jgi:predicted dehydrogenase
MSVRLGIIGAGNMGKNHIRLATEMNNLFELTAVYDPDNARIQALNLEKIAANSVEDLLSKCEAVIIAAPSSLHKELAIKVAEAEKHLLVEKPLALSESDAQEITDRYLGTDCVLMVGHVERFNGAIMELEKILENEKIVAVNIERCSSKDLRISDTDVVYDLMIHDIDILLHSIMPNVRIKRISTSGRRVYSSQYVDYVHSVFNFENDVIASITCSRTTENKIRKMNIHCENSYIEVDLLDKSIHIYRRTQLKDMGIFSSAYKQENIVEKVFVPINEPLKSELQHFYSCITGKTMCKTSGESALESISLLDTIKKVVYKV